MRIIDFHTHPSYNTTAKFGYDMTEELFIEDEKRAGISLACGSAFQEDYMLSGEPIDKIVTTLNDAVWAWHEKAPDFIYPGVTIHPDFPELSEKAIRKAYDRGFRLVGELVPEYLGCKSLVSDGFMELYALCRDLDMVLSIHSPDAAAPIAKAFPTMPVVLAHPGYNESYRNKLELAGMFDNLYLDLSGTGIAASGMLRFGIDRIGAEKFLFGTDFPGYNPAMYVESVLFERLTDTERESVFHKNAEYLLGLRV